MKTVLKLVALCVMLLCVPAGAQTITPQIGGGISTGFDGGISATRGVNPNCTQGATYVAALTSPTPAEIAAYKTAICSMVVHGTFAQLDALYIHANTSAANAEVNAVNPGTYNLTAHGTCTFTADEGFTGDGSTCYLDPGFVPSSAGGHMALNSASIGFCVLSSRSGASSVGFGGGGASGGITFIYPYLSNSTSAYGLNDGGGGYTNRSGSAGSWIESRIASSGPVLYLNGAALTNVSPEVSTSLPSATLYEFGYNNNGSLIDQSSDQQAYLFYGAGLTAAQVQSIYTDLGNMMSALGNLSSCAIVPPVTSAQNYFFNSTTGADTNNCKFASGSAPNGPCLTIARANVMLNYAGGSYTFVGTFTGCPVFSQSTIGGNTIAVPITIAMTGATITSNCGGTAAYSPEPSLITIDSISATINGGTLRGSGLVSGSATQNGIIVQNSSGVGVGAAAPTVIIENVDISGFSAVGLTSYSGNEITVSAFSQAAGFPTGVCGSVNVQVINSTLHGATTTAADDNGIGGSACGGGGVGTPNVTVQGTIVANMGGRAGANAGLNGNGMVLSTTSTGSGVSYSLAHDLGANLTANNGGPSAFFLAEGANQNLVEFTEAYNVHSTSFQNGYADYVGYDVADINVTSSLTQYCYSHNNDGPGFLMFNPNGSNTVRYCISENDNQSILTNNTSDQGGVFSTGGNAVGSSWAAYNLTIYETGNGTGNGSTGPACASLGFGNGTYTGGLWANNACYNAIQNFSGQTFMLVNGANNGASTINMVNNDYYNAGGTQVFAYHWDGSTNYATLSAFNTATGQEANSIITNPTFASPPSGTCTWTPSTIMSWPPSGCPTAYSTVSGLKSAGANLASLFPTYFASPYYPTTAGTRDYYNDPIPGTGPCYNMGAYGVCP
jgi:hypothetical protein